MKMSRFVILGSTVALILFVQGAQAVSKGHFDDTQAQSADPCVDRILALKTNVRIRDAKTLDSVTKGVALIRSRGRFSYAA